MNNNIQTFALFDSAKQSLKMDDWKTAHQQFAPFSTFKIINSLIAIDQGYVEGDKTTFTFDPKKYPIEKWWPKKWYEKPLTLRDAFQSSAVPIYRQLATRIGQQTMQDYLNKLNYGNRDISSGLDNFWLNGSLKISPVEQVSVLRRLFNKQTPVEDNTLNELKKVMQVETWGDYNLFAKTGMGTIETHVVLGWYVGMLEHRKKPSQAYYFAGLISGPTIQAVQQQRIEYTKSQLQKYVSDLNLAD